MVLLKLSWSNLLITIYQINMIADLIKVSGLSWSIADWPEPFLSHYPIYLNLGLNLASSQKYLLDSFQVAYAGVGVTVRIWQCGRGAIIYRILVLSFACWWTVSRLKNPFMKCFEISWHFAIINCNCILISKNLILITPSIYINPVRHYYWPLQNILGLVRHLSFLTDFLSCNSL